MKPAGGLGVPSLVRPDPGANRILVVDDDLSQRVMLMRILRKAKYEISVATSTEEARLQLQSGAFGLVVTDLHMFAEDGIELVRHVAEHHPETYSMVVSGFATETDIDRVSRAGAFELMLKPIDADHFLIMVERAFDHREESEALRRHRSE